MKTLFAWPLTLAAVAAGAADPPPLNEKVAKFAEAHLGKQVGNGECWTLADEALAAAGAQRPGRGGYGPHVFGRALGADEPPLAGDVVQFKDARFETKGGVAVMPQHTAVVARADGKKLELLHQNWNDDRRVSRLKLDLADLKRGEVRVYRPEPAK